MGFLSQAAIFRSHGIDLPVPRVFLGLPVNYPELQDVRNYQKTDSEADRIATVYCVFCHGKSPDTAIVGFRAIFRWLLPDSRLGVPHGGSNPNPGGLNPNFL